MPWLKVSDAAAMHQKIMMIPALPGSDTRLANEIMGFIIRLATQSAGLLTNYRVELGHAYAIGGARTHELLKISEAVGLLTPLTEKNHEGIAASYELTQETDLFHIRSKEEVEWERQRKRDNYAANPVALRVRARDGENCRWCGVRCQPLGRTSARSLTLDHLIPGEEATDETLVVACFSCNSARKDNAEKWAQKHELSPIPNLPVLSKASRRMLEKAGLLPRKYIQWESNEIVTGDAADEPHHQSQPGVVSALPIPGEVAAGNEVSPTTGLSAQPGKAAQIPRQAKGESRAVESVAASQPLDGILREEKKSEIEPVAAKPLDQFSRSLSTNSSADHAAKNPLKKRNTPTHEPQLLRARVSGIELSSARGAEICGHRKKRRRKKKR